MKILVVSLVRTFAHLWHGKLYMFQFCTGYIEGVILPWTFHLILPCKMNRLIRREALLSSWKITKDSTASIYVFLILYQKRKSVVGKLLKGCPKSLFEVPRRKKQELLWPDESEQATVHSAPCPLPFLSDLKATAKVLDFDVNSSGPLVPQNLVNAKLKLKNNRHTALIFSTSKTVPNLFFPMVR